MLKPFPGVFALAFALVSGDAGAQEKALPQQLVQYVRDARKAGLDDASIQQKAVNAGWPSASVKDVIANLAPGNVETKTANSTAAPPADRGVSGSPALPAPAQPSFETPALISPAALALPAGEDGGARTNPGVNRGVAEDYRIGEGDVLSISVWGERDASVPSVVVRHDGRISMPLIKEVFVAGMTPPEAEKFITDQLSKMLKAPDVTIMVVQVNSKKIFMIGAVKKEGPMHYTYKMTVMQAISEAGGLTDYAKL